MDAASCAAVTRADLVLSGSEIRRRGLVDVELVGSTPTHLLLKRELDQLGLAAESNGWSATRLTGGSWRCYAWVKIGDLTVEVASAYRTEMREGMRALLGELFILNGAK